MPPSTGTTPLFEYFSAYPTFTYNPNASPTSEFDRMCKHFHWDRDDEDQEEAYQAFRIALTKEFNNKYGTDVNELAAWQSLCVRLGVDPIPEKIKQCRQIVTTTHVNLVDLVSNSRDVTIFSSVAELSEYSRTEKKIFPREEAHAGELLKYLLRHIFNPSKDARRGLGRRGQSNRGKGGRGAGGGQGRGGRGAASGGGKGRRRRQRGEVS